MTLQVLPVRDAVRFLRLAHTGAQPRSSHTGWGDGAVYVYISHACGPTQGLTECNRLVLGPVYPLAPLDHAPRVITEAGYFVYGGWRSRRRGCARRSARRTTRRSARRCARQTISASAPAVARVVLQVESAPAPADATCFSVSVVTCARRSPGHVADAHTLVVVVS